MKAQILKARTTVFLIVLSVFVLALSSCGRRSGCPGLITKSHPTQKEVRA